MASIIASILEVGRYPVIIDIITHCIKYILRFFTLPPDSLLGLASLEHIVASQEEKSTPFQVYMKVCNSAGVNLKNIDKNKLSAHKINSIGRKVKKSLITLFNKHGIQKIKTIPKLGLYAAIKTTSRSEPYLDLIKNPMFRSVLTRYRISDHYFPIESMRCTSLMRTQRLCLSCDINASGDLATDPCPDCSAYANYLMR